MTIPNEVVYILIAAHAVNTLPTPKNIYLQWLLGIAKFAVGQRLSAMNSFNGLQTEVTAVTTEQKKALQNGSKMEVVKTPSVVTVVATPDQKESL